MKINNNKGFSLMELIVLILIMGLLTAVFAPTLIQYVEKARQATDEAALGEIVNVVKIAMSNESVFNEVYNRAINNNYLTYSDSTGTYGSTYLDGEYYAPDGCGRAVTITFNHVEASSARVMDSPDKVYYLKNGILNDMTIDNGSVVSGVQRKLEARNEDFKDDITGLVISEIDGGLWEKIRQGIGETVKLKSETYKNASMTIFIHFYNIGSTVCTQVYGQFSGTNLDTNSYASKGSGTTEYIDDGIAVTTINGGKCLSNFTEPAFIP